MLKIDAAIKTILLIVAHPDDETLWAGGTMLSHPTLKWFVICLCRGQDEDRAPRFYKALKMLNAQGCMGDLDDGPEQKPLDEQHVAETILELLPAMHVDLIISHSPSGEYTRHRRHEEIGQAVIKLWHARKLSTNEYWAFAYEDGDKGYFPRAIKKAPVSHVLPDPIWQKKYELVTNIYGFETGSWEAQTTPRTEAFWCFRNAHDATTWLEQCPTD